MINAVVSLLVNHLWQSTLCAAAAWLLAWALRHNRAAVRHGVWMAASVKFLVPFVLLAGAGSRLSPRAAEGELPQPPRFRFLAAEIGRSLALPVRSNPNEGRQTRVSPVPMLLAAIWCCGFAASLATSASRRRKVRAALRGASPLPTDLPVQVMSSPARLEPGVFGIFKPVLLIPAGIADRLSPAQFQAILAHELCHIQRRDNLTGAIHMLVEAIFWFYPPVWWIRERLVEERERACDEEVLGKTADPGEYAEGILNVCKFYVESPLVCMPGVTGSNLKKRIEAIMTQRITSHLNPWRRMLLAAAGILVVAGPVVVGFLNGPQLKAQPQAAPAYSFEVASIKQHKPGDGRYGFPQFLPGRFRSPGAPLHFLIAIAYDLPFQSPRLSGGPDWVRSEQGMYDIDAKVPDGALPEGLTTSEGQTRKRAMLQALLAERFHLKLRRETKELPIYELTIAKGGPKLQKAKLEEKDCKEDGVNGVFCHQIGGGLGRGIDGKAVDVSDLAQFVSNWTDRPVVDKTGLKGLYEVKTEGWVPMRARPPRADGQPDPEGEALADPTRPTLFVLFERLGLKLDAVKGPIEMFIIDHVERPTEN